MRKYIALFLRDIKISKKIFRKFEVQRSRRLYATILYNQIEVTGTKNLLHPIWVWKENEEMFSAVLALCCVKTLGMFIVDGSK